MRRLLSELIETQMGDRRAQVRTRVPRATSHLIRARRAPALFAAVAVGAILALGAPLAAQADQIRAMEFWLSDYGIQQAWATTEGAGIKVAVIDTGVDGNIADLAGAVVGGTDESAHGSPTGETPLGSTDDSGHATWVASLIAGRGTGGSNGLIGVAPKASILSVSVALGSATAALSDDEQIARGIRWAVDNGATVINLSLTRNTLDWPTSWDSAFEYAFEHNVVIVAAAGNRGSGTTEVDAPATIPGVLAVGGVNRGGSESAEASSQGITIAVAAPSEQLLGADPSGGYVSWSGTSGAAPIVSGIVALVQAAHPGMSAANVINRVIRTAHAVGASPNPLCGYGLVDANAAVNGVVAPVTANPLGDLNSWITMHRRAQAPAPTASGAGSGDGASAGSDTSPGSRSSAGSQATDALKHQASAQATPRTLAPPSAVSARDVLVPSWPVLTQFGIPMSLVGGFAALVAAGVLLTRRHFRRGTPKG